MRELVDHCTSGACGLTPSDVALSGLGQGELDHLALEWREIEDIYPLSPMQQGMLFHTMHDGERELYVNQVAAEVRGVDAEATSGLAGGQRSPCGSKNRLRVARSVRLAAADCLSPCRGAVCRR